MEGRWKGGLAAAGVLAACIFGTTGCGDSRGKVNSLETKHPETAFAPVVLLAADEPWRPMSARWFIERSTLRFAQDRGCGDLEVAVGRTLPERRTEFTDWIYHRVLGGEGWAYYRSPPDVYCEQNDDIRAYADQHVRPHDRADRPPGVPPGVGFYLDLVDAERGGPEPLSEAVTYVDRADVGASAVLTYWMLFGMHAPEGRASETHEGDWERVDVLLRRDGDDRYEPRAVRLGPVDAEGAPATPRDVPWREVRQEDGHPVLTAERGSHTLTPAGACAECLRWRTWKRQEPVRHQAWHGFGGAWGDLGPTGATTGPLGPHGTWPAEDRGR